ncbi:tail fiber assembly protein [Escherichia coli]|uniref:tail fiber assembly protein n=1 Tax=Escherichia coli TaxID=562 RepID=UPI0007E3565F|nr:tail fiber assembly protein [Escherichia coli]EFG2177739.1 tail fiber assembly protein [Escherichia coli]EFL5792547.1 tail fiber assembly protein [Escherichia coli]EFM8839373.1 tail fiber assembly protein [Escherichia coli]EIO6567064.1 tail fiber assembly protein [Escherichia coli]EKM2781853.1 tail fiber assembly protein [Escherichia coli]
MYLFSPSTLGFYPIEMKEEYLTNGSLPSDVIEVSDSVRNEYNFAPPEGKQLSSSQNMPVWIDIPPPTREEPIAAAEQVRQQLLAHADATMLDWRTELMLGEISDANRAKLSASLAYKNEVKSVDVTTDPEHVNCPVPPEV